MDSFHFNCMRFFEPRGLVVVVSFQRGVQDIVSHC